MILIVRFGKGLPEVSGLLTLYKLHFRGLFCLIAKLCLTLLPPHGLQPARLLCLWDFPGKNTVLLPLLWNLLQFPSPGYLPDLGIEPTSALANGFLTIEPLGKHEWDYDTLFRYRNQSSGKLSKSPNAIILVMSRTQIQIQVYLILKSLLLPSCYITSLNPY